jgi:diaminopropionate ammonia-lyase
MFMIAPPSLHQQATRPHLLHVLGTQGRARAERFLSACPAHRATPLVAWRQWAQQAGIGSLHIKDEGQRLGLKSFKALGGAYAVMSLVLARAEQQLQRTLAPNDLLTDAVKAVARTITVTCATDGNHGRSVAAGARLAGCRCVIFVHRGVSQARADAIAALGADVRREGDIYDDAVQLATASAAREGWLVVSDTSWAGYEDIPLTVMQGYTVMAGEAFDALPTPPTHVFLQAGVGGMAAAVVAHAVAVYREHAPTCVIAEPARAACLMASATAGKRSKIAHGEPTVMGMLECYEPSPIAWEILAPRVAAYVTLEEDDAVLAMRQLASPLAGDAPIVAGESGGTGWAALKACLANAAARQALGLDATSRVLLFNSEGATDADTFHALVGRSHESVVAGGHR